MALHTSLLHEGTVPDRTAPGDGQDCQLLCLSLPWLSSSRIHSGEGLLDYLFDFFRHVLRGLSSDLSDPRLCSPAEKNRLEKTHQVRGHIAQNFLAWRRSGLVVMLIPLCIQFVLACIKQIHFQRDQTAVQRNQPIAWSILRPLYATFDAVAWTAISLILIAIVLGALALHYWPRYKLSMRLVFIAWLCYFGGPFLVTLFPYRLALDFSKIQRQLDATNSTAPATAVFASVGISVGAAFAVFALVLLAPAVFTLPLSIARTALTVRTLLPQSQVPAFVLRSGPLVTLPLLWLIFVAPIQILGHPLLWIAVLLYLGAPFEFVLFGHWIAPPMSAHDAHKYALRLKFMYLGTNLLAVVLAIAYVVGVLNVQLKIKALDVIEFLIAFIGEYFFSNIAIGDILVRRAAREVYHELYMRQHHPELHADWLDRRTQIFEITGFKDDLSALAHEDKRKGTAHSSL